MEGMEVGKVVEDEESSTVVVFVEGSVSGGFRRPCGEVK